MGKAGQLTWKEYFKALLNSTNMTFFGLWGGLGHYQGLGSWDSQKNKKKTHKKQAPWLYGNAALNKHMGSMMSYQDIKQYQLNNKKISLFWEIWTQIGVLKCASQQADIFAFGAGDVTRMVPCLAASSFKLLLTFHLLVANNWNK